MPSTYRRSGSRSRSTFGSYSGFSYGPSGSSWGSWGSSGSRRTGGSKSSKRGGGSSNPGAYRTVCNNLSQKIDSFKTLYAQTTGPASYGRPTPGMINTFANWINKGAIIQTCSVAQVSRWARNQHKNFNPRNPSPNACKTVLCSKFGRSAIKAVCKGKGGTFMVATTPTVNGRSFCFPK